MLGKLGGMPILLITVAGRMTGNLYTNPVLYLEDAGRLCGDRLGRWVCRCDWLRVRLARTRSRISCHPGSFRLYS